MKKLLKSKAFHAGLGFLVSAGLILWLVVSLDWQVVLKRLGQVNFLWLIPTGALFLFHFYLRALRWRHLLPDTVNYKTVDLFDGIMIGGLATFVLPLRAGEFIRPFVLTKRSEVSFSVAFVSVVVERFFDLSVVLISFALMTAYIPDIPDWVYSGALALGVIAVAIFVFMLIGSFAPARARALGNLVLDRAPEKLSNPLKKLQDDLLEGAAVLARLSRLLKVVVYSALVWLTCYLFFYLFFLSFGMQPSFWVAVSVAVIIALAVAAPSAPGFVGVYQVACIAAFALYALDEELAIAYSIVSHVVQYIIIVAYGMYALSKHHMKLGELQGAMPQPAVK